MSYKALSLAIVCAGSFLLCAVEKAMGYDFGALCFFLLALISAWRLEKS